MQFNVININKFGQEKYQFDVVVSLVERKPKQEEGCSIQEEGYIPIVNVLLEQAKKMWSSDPFSKPHSHREEKSILF